jgi:hypothetical protein
MLVLGNHPAANFPAAFLMAASGKKITRDGWNGNNLDLKESQGEVKLFVAAQFPDKNSKMGNPYLYIDAKGLGGECNPWVPSQTDLFAEDWYVVVESE